MKINIFKELIDSLFFLKTLTFKKIINGFLLRLSYYISKYIRIYIHWGKPESISIEPTNICNLNCPECSSGNNSMTRSKLFLLQNDFINSINQLSDYLSHLQLFFQGEPFLHPKIFEFISYATQKSIYTSTSTNGQFLTTEDCDKIVKSGLHRIVVSVDGTTQEVYEKYRVGGSLAKVTSGITNLVESKKRLKSKTPFIIMQFVVFSTNEHQIDDVKELAKSLKVEKLQIKTAQIDDFKNGNTLIPINIKYSRYYKNNDNTYSLNRNPNFKCQRVWNGLVVSADNNLLPCCFDKDANYKFNTNEDSDLLSSWNSKKLRSFRQKVWNNNSLIDMCQNCTEGIK